MSKFYVAGPMRGYEFFNFPAFDECAATLRDMGHEAVNPAEIDRALGLDETSPTAEEDFEKLGGIAQAMHRDFGVILECDGIVLMPGWERSSGARGELFVAQTTGRSVYTYDPESEDWDTVLSPYSGPGPELAMPPRATIIGISGYARAGKDTLGLFLCEAGFERRSFADALRDVLYAMNPMVEAQVFDAEPQLWSVRALVDKYGWEDAKATDFGSDFTVRKYLQRLGTEAGRKVLGENIWVDTAMSTLEVGGKYVFTDVRFINEADAIRNLGGKVIRIERPGTDAINAHPSETALDGYDFDQVIVNDGTINDLRMIARSLVAE